MVPLLPRKKEEYKQMILGRFGEHHYKQIRKHEKRILESLGRKKKPYEKLAIEKANEITNAMLDEFGLTPFDVPERNIHIMPKKLYKEIESDDDVPAVTFQEQQLIALNAERTVHPIYRVSIILHEITHLKNFLAIEAHEDLYKSWRRGLKIGTSRRKAERIGYFEAFSGLDEAVVSEIQKKYLPGLLQQNKFLADEYNWEISKEAHDLKEKAAREEEIDTDEIIWITKDGKDYGSLPYYEERKVLSYIVDRLYKDNADKFDSRDEVMKLFFKSHFDGRLLLIARLIEESFGKGSFRMVGMMDDENTNSARLVMDYLTKHKSKDT